MSKILVISAFLTTTVSACKEELNTNDKEGEDTCKKMSFIWIVLASLAIFALVSGLCFFVRRYFIK